jgi:hypothetical protein
VNGQVCQWGKQGWECSVFAGTKCNEDVGVKRGQDAADPEEAFGIKPFKKGKTQKSNARDSTTQVKEVKSDKSSFKKKQTSQPVGTIDNGKSRTPQSTSQAKENPKIRSAGIKTSPETQTTDTEVSPASVQKPITKTSIPSSAARPMNRPDMSEFEVALEAVVKSLGIFRRALRNQQESIEGLVGSV